jgi:hypothetical protein
MLRRILVLAVLGGLLTGACTGCNDNKAQMVSNPEGLPPPPKPMTGGGGGEAQPKQGGKPAQPASRAD